MRAPSRLAIFALGLAGGCSGSPAATDMSASGDLGSPPDLGAAGPDMLSVATGTRILPGRLGGLRGVTRDDHAVVFDRNGDVLTVPLGGGAPAPVAAGADNMSVRGKVLFAWTNTDMDGAGDLTVWTAAAGAKSLGSGSYVSEVSATADGASILYTLGATGTRADLWVARSDGSAARKVLAQVDFDPSCSARFQAVGSKFLAVYCLPPGDGGVAGATLGLIDPAGGAPTELAQGLATFFSVDQAGEKAFVAKESGEGLVVPLAGGPATPIDTDVGFGYLTSDGATAIYRTRAQGLKKSAVAMPAPVGLVQAGVTGLSDHSADWKYVVYYAKGDAKVSFYSDLYMASTAGPGMPNVLSAKTNSAIFGDAFTADQSRVLYFTECNAAYVGRFQSQPVAGGTPTTHASLVWTVYGTRGTQVVYNDNFKPFSTTPGRGDLRVVDVATGDPPSLVATAAEVDFYLNAARDKIVYITNSAPGAEGLYVAPVP